MFALINLNIQRRFTSGHGLALYENCYRFVRTGSTGWWPIDTFRRLMGVDDSAYYESFKHLNAKIIKPAVDEVNRTSNIDIAPEFQKRGRAVTEIRFLIRENKQLAMFDIDDGEALRAGPVYVRLIGQGVSDRLARQWIQEHGEETVAAKLDYVSGQAHVRSPVGYLRAVLEGVPEVPAVVPVVPPSPIAVAAVQRQRDAQALLVAEQDARFAARDARNRRRSIVADTALQRNPTQRDSDRQLFMSRLTTDLDREDFRKHGWASALNASAIFDFWAELSPGLFSSPGEVQ